MFLNSKNNLKKSEYHMNDTDDFTNLKQSTIGISEDNCKILEY